MPRPQAEAQPATYHFGRLLARCYELALMEGQAPDAILFSAIEAPRAVASRVSALLEEQGKSDWQWDLDAHLLNLPPTFDEQAISFYAKGFDQELVRLIRMRWYGFWSPLALQANDREAGEKRM